MGAIKLHFMRYYGMSSWNLSKAPAFNLKLYNVIPKDLLDRAYSLLEGEEFCDMVNSLLNEFNRSNDFEWQAGFNGRTGGYLVLYKGGCERKLINDKMFEKEKMVYVSDGYGWMNKERAIKIGIFNKEIITRIYTMQGKNIEFSDVPNEVLKDFKELAERIVEVTIELAKEKIAEEEAEINN